MTDDDDTDLDALYPTTPKTIDLPAHEAAHVDATYGRATDYPDDPDGYAERGPEDFTGGYDAAPPTDPDYVEWEPDPDQLTEPLTILRFDQLPDTPPIEAELLKRHDGKALLYRGAVHSIAGDPGIGKTFAALIAVLQAITAGEGALTVDYEDTPGRLRNRLLALGATAAQLALVYGIDRPGRLLPDHVTQLVDLITDENIAVAVIDSATEAIEAHDLDENQGRDYARWQRLTADRLAQAGAAVVIIDHRTKPPEGKASKAARNLWSVGSRHKLAGISGAAYILESREPFARTHPGRTGVLDLIIAKDRHGAIGARGDIAARIQLTPTTEGAITTHIAATDTTDAYDPNPTDERTRHTNLERILSRRTEILAHIATQHAHDPGAWLPTRTIHANLRTLPGSAWEGPKPHIPWADLRDALHRWAADGYLESQPHRGGHRWLPAGANDHPTLGEAF